MKPAGAVRASHVRHTGTLVWKCRCSAELLWLSLAGEQKFKPLSSFSVAYIVLAKSHLEVKETPSNKESPMPSTAVSSSLLSCWVVGLIFVGFWFFLGFCCCCCFVLGSFLAFLADAKTHLCLHLNRGCSQSTASMLAGDCLFFLPNVLQTSWFHLGFFFFVFVSDIYSFGCNCFSFCRLCSCQVMPWLFCCLFQTSSKVRLTLISCLHLPDIIQIVLLIWYSANNIYCGAVSFLWWAPVFLSSWTFWVLKVSVIERMAFSMFLSADFIWIKIKWYVW